MRPFAGNRTVQGRLNKSFTAKLIQSSDTIKQYYADLANEFLIYEKIRNRISWANSCFVAGRKNVSKVSIKGKTLYLHLALEPENFRGETCLKRDFRDFYAIPSGLSVFLILA